MEVTNLAITLAMLQREAPTRWSFKRSRSFNIFEAASFPTSVRVPLSGHCDIFDYPRSPIDVDACVAAQREVVRILREINYFVYHDPYILKVNVLVAELFRQTSNRWYCLWDDGHENFAFWCNGILSRTYERNALHDVIMINEIVPRIVHQWRHAPPPYEWRPAPESTRQANLLRSFSAPRPAPDTGRENTPPDKKGHER